MKRRSCCASPRSTVNEGTVTSETTDPHDPFRSLTDVEIGADFAIPARLFEERHPANDPPGEHVGLVARRNVANAGSPRCSCRPNRRSSSPRRRTTTAASATLPAGPDGPPARPQRRAAPRPAPAPPGSTRRGRGRSDTPTLERPRPRSPRRSSTLGADPGRTNSSAARRIRSGVAATARQAGRCTREQNPYHCLGCLTGRSSRGKSYESTVRGPRSRVNVARFAPDRSIL
jgi:hypothetical protein